MTTCLSSFLTRRRLIALTLGAALAGCGGTVPVRQGPQAVHPGTSMLARGNYAAPTAHYTVCGADQRKLCHTPKAGDGSTPIID